MAKGPVSEFHFPCTRCFRLRPEKYMIQRKNRKGKRVWRCRAKSVCSSKARRFRERRAD